MGLAFVFVFPHVYICQMFIFPAGFKRCSTFGELSKPPRLPKNSVFCCESCSGLAPETPKEKGVKMKTKIEKQESEEVSILNNGCKSSEVEILIKEGVLTVISHSEKLSANIDFFYLFEDKKEFVNGDTAKYLCFKYLGVGITSEKFKYLLQKGVTVINSEFVEKKDNDA